VTERREAGLRAEDPAEAARDRLDLDQVLEGRAITVDLSAHLGVVSGAHQGCRGRGGTREETGHDRLLRRVAGSSDRLRCH
jgi:hypothetical protein